MASVSATHLIMFIGSLVIASAVAGTVVMEVGEVSDSIEMRGGTVSDEIETDIAIISDESQPDAMVENDTTSDGYNVSVLVKNVGSKDVSADPSAVDALVDGTYSTVTAVERVDADTNTWNPGGVVEVTISTADVGGDTEVVVLVNDDEDTITFYWEDDA